MSLYHGAAHYLVGQRFGKLVVQSFACIGRYKRIYWNCICDCGNTRMTSTSELRAGFAKSCGCSKRDIRKNLAGLRFGMLTVISCTGNQDRNGNYIWNCRCDCGNDTVATTSRLRRKRRSSCGCIGCGNKLDLAGQRFGKLKVIERAGFVEKSRIALWRCICDCGKETRSMTMNLRSGASTSCGCKRGRKRK